MMIDWNGYQQQVIAGVAEIGKISLATVRGYRELSDAGSNNRTFGDMRHQDIVRQIRDMVFAARV